jgi:hypothetical protein
MPNNDIGANYIADMCNQLAKLARENGFDLGAYLLTIAALEFANKRTSPAKRRTNEECSAIKHS